MVLESDRKMARERERENSIVLLLPCDSMVYLDDGFLSGFALLFCLCMTTY